MRRIWAALTVLAFLTSCASSPGLLDAPLSAIDLAGLRCNLYGEWQGELPPGGELVGGEAWRWLFFDDGSGVRAPLGRDSAENARAFLWALEGANVRIGLGGEEGTIYRRVEEWDQDRMVWFDYELGREKQLSRRSVGRRPARCESL